MYDIVTVITNSKKRLISCSSNGLVIYLKGGCQTIQRKERMWIEMAPIWLMFTETRGPGWIFTDSRDVNDKFPLFFLFLSPCLS